MDKKLVILIVAIVVAIILAVGAGIWFWRQSAIKNSAVQNAIDQAVKGTVPSINTTNPIENKPDLNPADAANPIKNIKTNPFE